MKSTIFIPKLCKVGFNDRSDTYTGRLAYVIYNDGKKWRKEDSWNSWIKEFKSEEEMNQIKIDRYNQIANQILSSVVNGTVDKWFAGWGQVKGQVETIEDVYKILGPIEKFKPTGLNRISSDPKMKPFEFENKPTEGFVLNKKVGGYSSGWNARQTYCRVYDPRGFEFEISVQNLLYILENTNSIKGKGLEGQFIYGWSGKDLVLVPQEAPEFKEMLEFTELQNKNIKKSELVIGGIYLDSYGNKLTYLGDGYSIDRRGNVSSTKKTWFKISSSVNDAYYHITSKDIKSIKKFSGEINPNVANWIDKLYKADEFSKEKPVFHLVQDPTEVLSDLLKVKGDYTRRFYHKSLGGFKQLQITLYTKNEWFNNTKKPTYSVIETESRYKNDATEFENLYQLTNKITLWELKTMK